MNTSANIVGLAQRRPSPRKIKSIDAVQEAEQRAKDLAGLSVDDITGVVGDAAWEAALKEQHQGADSMWGLS